MSEREPELGLGLVARVERAQIQIRFPATGEVRLYALGTSVLRRVQFGIGETVTARSGNAFAVERVEEEAGLLVYHGQGRRLREDDLSDVTSVTQPQERLMAGQADDNATFELRLRTLEEQARLRGSDLRGFAGGRIALIPHQLHILQEVSSRQIPRVLLADEVGLGKTIEACLILQRLLAIGKARRALVLVPEALTHQWFVELLRRFNLWFSIYDEERCVACEQSGPDQNPFLAEQLALCSIGFLAGNPARRDQAVAAGWDLVIVDEAHHLEWSPERSSPEYELVELLARGCPGLILLTATPTQLGLAGHFARLRLLDPNRFDDFERFARETENYGKVAAIADKIVDKRPLTAKDLAALRRIFDRDPDRLEAHLAALTQGKSGAHDALLQTLLDQHGTGRVVFRNTRAVMPGFPKRSFRPAPLEGDHPTLLARIAREMEAEETGRTDEIRYSYKDDPRIAWLADLLQEVRPDKVLLCCRSPRKVTAIAAALQEKTGAKVALFHEEIPLVQRDRNAAWFAEPDGAQLLLCSEIGSEGRNFQFAHHLVLFDLPLNPGLIEQRIGRLDRIGQTQTVRIHVPYLAASGEACVVDWYHRGLDAFEAPQHGGDDYEEAFKTRLLELATDGGHGRRPSDEKTLKALLADTTAFRKDLAQRLKKGRDRLLELNSFRPESAARLVERIHILDTNAELRRFLLDLVDHFGVTVKEHEEGDVFLDPATAYVEAFPSLPREGMLATFDRTRALAREDIRFISADHPLVRDAIDLLLDSAAGTSAFGLLEAAKPRLLLEVVFVLEAVADTRWHIDQFLAPTPVRAVVDVTGADLSAERAPGALAGTLKDGNLRRFLEGRGFKAAHLKTMLEKAQALAAERSVALKAAAKTAAETTLTPALERLIALQKVNPHVSEREIALTREQLEATRAAIEQATPRLDSLRLVLEGPGVMAFAAL